MTRRERPRDRPRRRRSRANATRGAIATGGAVAARRATASAAGAAGRRTRSTTRRSPAAWVRGCRFRRRLLPLRSPRRPRVRPAPRLRRPRRRRPCSPIPSTTEADTGVPTLERPYTPVAEGPFRPTLPRLKLALAALRVRPDRRLGVVRRRRRARDVQQPLDRRLPGVADRSRRPVDGVRLAVGHLARERRLLRHAVVFDRRSVRRPRPLRSVRGGVRRRRLHAPLAVRPHDPDGVLAVRRRRRRRDLRA